MLTYIFDLDNTFTKTIGSDYPNAQPIKQRIAEINRLYDEGAIVIIATSRGQQSGKDWYNFTKKQLESWGVKYSELMLKPHYDKWIDDKAINAKDWINV
jgi:hypothetical protein